MTALLWLVIPVVATVCAIAWLSWRGRPRVQDTHTALAERERFNQALSDAEHAAADDARASHPAPPPSTDEPATGTADPERGDA